MTTSAFPDNNDSNARSASIIDVARVANVSVGTVSNYLNYPNRVSETLKGRIGAAIQQLGYVQTRHRFSSTTSPNCIGYVMTDIEMSLFTTIFEGAQEAAKEHGLQLIAACSVSDKERQTELVRMLCQMNVQGLLLSSVYDSQDDIRYARVAQKPVIMIDHRNPFMHDVCTVLEDNAAGAQMAVSELVRTRCQHIAIVTHSSLFQALEEREENARKAIERLSGITVETIEADGISIDDGYSIGRNLLKRTKTNMPDGIIANTDGLADGLLTALLEDGTYRIPDDISIIGMEGCQREATCPMPLTTVRAPGSEIGKQAFELLLDEITNPMSHVHSTVLLPPTLIPRKTTRA